MDTSAACHAPSLLADGVDLIEDDDVHTAVCSQLWERRTPQERGSSGSNANKLGTSRQAQPNRERTVIPWSKVCTYQSLFQRNCRPSSLPTRRWVGSAQSQDSEAGKRSSVPRKRSRPNKPRAGTQNSDKGPQRWDPGKAPQRDTRNNAHRWGDVPGVGNTPSCPKVSKHAAASVALFSTPLRSPLVRGPPGPELLLSRFTPRRSHHSC